MLHKSALPTTVVLLFRHRVPGKVCPTQGHHFTGSDLSWGTVLQKVSWPHPDSRQQIISKFYWKDFPVWPLHPDCVFLILTAWVWKRRAKLKLFGRSIMSKLKTWTERWGRVTVLTERRFLRLTMVRCRSCQLWWCAHHVRCGVFQGSVFEPGLFTLYPFPRWHIGRFFFPRLIKKSIWKHFRS